MHLLFWNKEKCYCAKKYLLGTAILKDEWTAAFILSTELAHLIRIYLIVMFSRFEQVII